MFVFKVFMLCALINIACSVPDKPVRIRSGPSANKNYRDVPADSGPVKLPMYVLKELVDISDNSKGLFLLWRNAFYLTKDGLLKEEVS